VILGSSTNLPEAVLGYLGLVRVWAKLEDLLQRGGRLPESVSAQAALGQLLVLIGTVLSFPRSVSCQGA
jgi:hypothetical protein